MLQKIDVHTHILPPTLPEGCDISLRHHADGRVADMLRADGSFFRRVECNCYDPSQRLVDCDATGVSVQVLSTVPVLFSYDKPGADGLRIARALNDHISGVVRGNPQRFAGLGTVPLQAPELACDELRRCVESLGLRGVQVGSHVNHQHLGDPAFEPFWTLAAKLDAAIFVHPWDMSKAPHAQEFWQPWLVGMPAETAAAYYAMSAAGVFERHQNMRVLFAHGGGAFPSLLGRFDHGYAARPDICATRNPTPPSAYARRVWVDSHVCDPEALRFLIAKMGVDKVALGSDYPFPLGELQPGALIEALDLNEATQRKLLVHNALTWLGLTDAFFLLPSAGA